MDNNKPVILIFADYFSPGYRAGGPIKTLGNLVNVLRDRFTFKIVTRNNDLHETEPYKEVRSDEWVNREGIEILYLSKKKRNLIFISKILKNTHHDLVYLNSFFSPEFTLKPLIAKKLLQSEKPAVIAPRGEFSPEALRIKDAKKNVFIGLSKWTGFYRKLIWQASSEAEKKQIMQQFRSKNVKIVVAPNIVELKSNGTPLNKNGELKIAFIARIAPMKNLDFALRVLTQLDINITFNIYGPVDDDAYWYKCQQLILNMPDNVTVVYHGPVSPDDLSGVLNDSHLVFLPTKGENFGHVIIEALGHGCPVLISNNTPWNNLEKYNAGWSVSLDDKETFRNTIRKLAGMNESEYSALREGVRQYANNYFHDNNHAQANEDLFLTAMGVK